MSNQPPKPPEVDRVIRVKVVDVDLPFNAIVGLMLKCLPAVAVVAIFVGVIWSLASMALSTLVG